MLDYLAFGLLGLGSGATYAAIGCGLVVAFRGSEVINFAQGAVAMACTYVFADLYKTGVLRLPIPGLPSPQLMDGPTSLWFAFVVALAFAAILGLLIHLLVFWPLRKAPALARVVSSVGVMLTLQAAAQIRYGEVRRQPARFLPDGRVSLGHVVIPVDRLVLVGIVVALTVVLMVLYRYTGFGRSTEVVATSDRAAAILGVSASRIAALNWIIASVLAAVGGILISPIGGVDVANYSLFVVPALGAALIGRFTSFGVTCAAGIGIGLLQGVVSKLQAAAYVPDWARYGVKDGLPFLIVLLVVAFLGQRIPTRGSVALSRLPSAPAGSGSTRGALALVALAVFGIAATGGPFRLALLIGMVFAVLGLSLVVLTGYVGQISLAQAAFAGTGAFTAVRLSSDAGVPLLLAQLIAVAAAVVLGLLIGLSALRTRGVTLAVVTLAAGVAVEQFVFKNTYFTGGQEGSTAPPLRYFGLDLSPGTGSDFPSTRFAVFLALNVCAVFFAVGRLRRSRLGARMLAVRANEMGAAAAGINVARTKILAFCISAMIAGWGGVLTAHLRGTVTFESFGVSVSLTILSFTYLGGISRPAGSIVGSFLAAGGIVAYLLDRYVELGQWTFLIGGLGLILTAIMNPDGIAGEFDKMRGLASKHIKGWSRRRSPTSAPVMGTLEG